VHEDRHVPEPPVALVDAVRLGVEDVRHLIPWMSTYLPAARASSSARCDS
jgi:hypothetical protein